MAQTTEDGDSWDAYWSENLEAFLNNHEDRDFDTVPTDDAAIGIDTAGLSRVDRADFIRELETAGFQIDSTTMNAEVLVGAKNEPLTVEYR